MESPKAVNLSVALLLLCFYAPSCMAYNFYVGGRDGWVVSPSEEYNRFAGSRRFQVNDTLTFKFKEGTDSVLLVTKEDYYGCNTDKPLMTMKSGTSVFKFDRSGPFFFISGIKDHCDKGQKLMIVVLAVRNKQTPPVTPTPPGTPSPVSQPPKSPSPGSSSPQNPPLAPTPPSSMVPSLAPKPQTPTSAPTPSTSTAPSLAPNPNTPSSPPSPPTSMTPSLAPTPSSNTPSLAPTPSTSNTPSLAPTPSTSTPSLAPSPSSSTPSPSTSSSPNATTSPPAPSPDGNNGTSDLNAPSPPRSSSWTCSPSSALLVAASVLIGAVIGA